MRSSIASVAALLVLGCLALRTHGEGEPSSPAGYSAASQYNLGNAYARSGKTPLAVLAYERARVLAPTDADLAANLARVRELAGLAPQRRTWLERHGRFADPNAAYWIGIFGLVLSGVSLLRLRRQPRPAPWIAVLVCGFGLVGASALNAASMSEVLSQSVAMTSTTAGVSPVSGADGLFAIPAASTVRVLDRHAGFELVRDAAGREGWVPSADLASIIATPDSTRRP